AVSKENMALWLVFIALGLAVLYWREPARRRWALAVAAVAFVYFVVIIKYVMPGLREDHFYFHQKNYVALGSTAGEVLTTLLTRPGYVLGLFFNNHLGVPDGDYVKLELHAMVLLSGGVALLRRPAYLLMLLPIYGQKLFSATLMHWGLNYQYSIEFVPVLHAAMSHWLAQTAPQRATRLAVVAAILTLAATVVSMQVRRSPYYDKSAAQFFKSRHYQVPFDAGLVHQGLELIPADARVSATSPLVPHLAARAYIYQFPQVDSADYIVALHQASTYPLSEAELDAKLAAYQASGQWRVRLAQGPLVILQRVQPLH
ncbi:MAG: hypothetical protein JWR44_2587, partial [Hymenobacter sp.]|nr:hypothetical protein [Hymenobacter sp.]